MERRTFLGLATGGLLAAQLATPAVRDGEAAELRIDAHRLVSCRVVRRGYSPSASSWAEVSATRGME
jgi:hypothetical protein